MIVVNKTDLISIDHRRRIESWLEQDHPGVPLFFTSAMDVTGKSSGIDRLLDAAIDKMRLVAPRLFKPSLEEESWPVTTASRSISQAALAATGSSIASAAATSLPVVMMVVGVPNVGKSSLINAFRRLAMKRGRAARAAQMPSRTTAEAMGADRRALARSAKPAVTGAKPGVTRQMDGFQVSWDPPVWMLDTPGVLTPRVDGGWEAALRLGVLDLIKYDESSLEPVAAYALHHIARTSAARLDRWPRVSALVHRTSGPDAGRDGVAALVALSGSGADVFESRVTPGAPGAPAADPAEVAERHARRLLSAVALDLGMTRRAAEVSRSERRGAEVPDTANAARKVLALLRQGELGPFCLDLHPPDLEKRPRSSRGSADAAALSGIVIRKPKRGVKEQA
jgi:ribosome biogenesis GTPase A